MSLIYRGQTYTTSSTVINTTATTSGTYRGQNYQIRQATNLKLRGKPGLTYRGVTYNQDSGQILPISGVAPVYS